jgi:lysophospholipase L1-like esterase
MKRITLIVLLMIADVVYCQHEKSNNDWPNLKKYAMENASLSLQRSNDKNVVLMGDSITEFWKTSNPEFFTRTGYIDRGISGQTTQQMLLRFRQDVIELKPSVVVILAGINDIAENTGPITLEQIMGNLTSMVELAKANKIKVVLCSVLPANAFWWNDKIKPADKVIALNILIKEYANKNHIPCVDYYSAMVNDEKGLDKKWGDDGVHPNLAGYKVMELLLERAVAKTLNN